MADATDPGKLRFAGAICCSTGDEIGPDELIRVLVQIGDGPDDDQMFFTTRDRLRAAFHPSIDVDFGAFDGEDDDS